MPTPEDLSNGFAEHASSVNSYFLAVYLSSRSRLAMEEFVEYTNTHPLESIAVAFSGGKLYGTYLALKALTEFLVEQENIDKINKFGKTYGETLMRQYHDQALHIVSKSTGIPEDKILEYLETLVSQTPSQYPFPKPSDLN